MKQSGFLAKIEARHQRELEEVELATLRFTRQVMMDATCADLINADTDDQDYSWTVLDKKLKQICGEYFVPFEERYK